MADDIQLLSPSEEEQSRGNMEDRILESRFECPICLSWLRDPLLTSCGHLFCSQCIHKWLKKEGAGCPVDNAPLQSEHDLFRDLRTSREMSQQRMNCPNRAFGCTAKLSPVDMQSHVSHCPHRTDVQKLVEEMTFQTNLDDAENTKRSIDYGDDDECLKKAQCPTEPDTDWRKLLKSLYERIVILEQQNRELSITVENQHSTILALQALDRFNNEDLASRQCFGMYVWKLDSFNERLADMILDSSKMIYSPGFYTHPNGYKMCARINISSKNSNFLSIVLHVMESENDEALDWPFDGLIFFTLVHPDNSEKSIRENTSSRPDLEAFQRPTSRYNKRSFGYTEFVHTGELKNFIRDNCLIFRITIRNRIDSVP